MKITLENIGKKYNSDWVFKAVNWEFESGSPHAIIGNNGSGKSTLLKVISGSLSPTDGRIEYLSASTVVNRDSVFKNISIAAPYIGLINEYTLMEMVLFHKRAKGLLKSLSGEELLKIAGLSLKNDYLINKLSSGMLQRLKLALALLTNSSLVLLDEPTVNLDEKGIAWYKEMVREFTKDRTIIICSNHMEEEYSFCGTPIIMENYK
jgi:ABC-type multidrug transport system ATPase subunit